MSKTNVNVRTGNRVAIVFDGKQIGAMQSVRFSDDYGLEQTYGIGDIDPFESVPTAARYTLSASNIVLKKGAMRSAGLIPENGTGALLGQVFDIEIYDKDDGTLLRKYTGCSYASGDMDIGKNAIIMASATFMALGVTGTGA